MPPLRKFDSKQVCHSWFPRRTTTKKTVCQIGADGQEMNFVARVAELADAYASGAYGVTLGGSNPLASTNFF